jgi:membrane fusion protein (multidrug efflux system)
VFRDEQRCRARRGFGPGQGNRGSTRPRSETRNPWLAVRRFLIAGLALFVGLAAAWYGYRWWTVGRFIESADDAYVSGEVTVIAPRVAGLIAEVAVTDNQAVHAGDLLVRLDDRDYRAALAKAVGAVAAKEAALANLDATHRLQESMIAQAEPEVVSANAEVARTQSDVERDRRLAFDQYASVQRLKQADADNRKAIAAAVKAHAALAAAQRRLDVIDTQKQETQAALVRRALDEGEGFCLCHDVRRLLYCASGYPDRLGFSGRDRRRIVGRTR